MARRRPGVVRLLVRLAIGAALFTAISFVPLVQQASARLSQKGILVEPNDALPGFDKTVNLGIGAEMVGFTWQGETTATIEVRSLIAGAWTDWTSLDGSPSEGPDHASRERHPQVSAGPTWLGHNINTIELRVTSGLAHSLVVHAIDTEPAPVSNLGVKPAGADTPLPFIATRAQWGADESLRTTAPSYADRVDFAVVHHTVNSNSYAPSDSPALVRGIYLYHTQVNGWSDIGYNFLVDRYGQVFEGRYGGINQAVIGAHTGGFNAGSTGVALIGNFDTAPVPDATYQSLRRLLDWKLAYHHINPQGTATHTVAESDCNCQRWPVGTEVTIPTILGHTDLDSTECPGRFMYALLPQLRNDVAMDIGNQGPAQWICQWDVPLNYGPGVDVPLPGRTDEYVRGGDGQLWQKVQTSSGSSAWSPLGGILTSDPDAAASGPNQFDVVVRGSDGAVWDRSFDGAAWSNWKSLGGKLASSPSIASWGPGHLAVFGCGMDGALWTRTLTAGTWGPWTSLGGFLFAAPDATSDGVNRLDVVVRGVGGGMYRRSFRNGAWSGWDTAGGGMASGGGVASPAPNSIVAATRGLDGALWVNTAQGSTWSGWTWLGGIITSDPDVASSAPDSVSVTAKGADGAYWQRVFNGSSWLPWHQL